jgi:hypothetical protein
MGAVWVVPPTREATFDLSCLASDPPSGAAPAGATQTNGCVVEGAGVFSEGAVRLEQSRCLRCRASVWVQVDALQSCNIARSIEDQRIAPSPVVSYDLEGQLSEIPPGLMVIYSLRRQEFVALETMLDASWRNRERLKDGTWTLQKLVDGYATLLLRADQWEEQLSVLRKWRTRSPTSLAAALIEARYWIAYSRFTLGKDPAAKLPPGAREIAAKRAATARSRLQASKRYAKTNPLWYYEMLGVATLERWPYAKRKALFDEAVRTYPDFDPIYVAMAASFAPHWGGSLAQHQEFVDLAVAQTKPRQGENLYAILYWNLSNIERDKDPFTELDIPWVKMKAGFTSLLERYPDSEWNLHNFAAFACRAGDAKSLTTLLPRLSEDAANRMRGAWTDAYTFEYCRNLVTKRI